MPPVFLSLASLGLIWCGFVFYGCYKAANDKGVSFMTVWKTTSARGLKLSAQWGFGASIATFALAVGMGSPQISGHGGGQVAKFRSDALPKFESPWPWTIQGIGVGLYVKQPCAAERSLLLQCRLTVDDQDLDLTFSDNGTRVVRVHKVTNFNEADYKPALLLQAAIDHYGKPEVYDSGNWLALYGDAFDIQYNGNRAKTELRRSGAGLLIQVHWCGVLDSENSSQCKGASIVGYAAEYDLVDAVGYQQAMEVADHRRKDAEQVAERTEELRKQQHAKETKF